MVAGDVPTAVSVSDKNAFAISFSFYIIILGFTLFVKYFLSLMQSQMLKLMGLSQYN